MQFPFLKMGLHSFYRLGTSCQRRPVDNYRFSLLYFLILVSFGTSPPLNTTFSGAGGLGGGGGIWGGGGDGRAGGGDGGLGFSSSCMTIPHI